MFVFTFQLGKCHSQASGRILVNVGLEPCPESLCRLLSVLQAGPSLPVAAGVAFVLKLGVDLSVWEAQSVSAVC